MRYDVIIVGGGIIGFSVAYQLLQKLPNLKVMVLEKETTPALHQTGHNSGVIHAGVYYAPGSLKAQFCVEGNRLSRLFFKEHNIPFQLPGKLIVATNDIELERMQALIHRCEQNNILFDVLNENETKLKQPGINGVGSLFIKNTGIVDWQQVTRKYADCFQALGGKIQFNEHVIDINENSQTVAIKTIANNNYECKYLITCGGLHADRLVKMSKLKPNFKILPFRGEYYRLHDKYSTTFKHLIYPVPDPSLPFLGVHFTPHVGGYTTVGPNAILALAREGYSWKQWKIKDAMEIAFCKSTWKLISRHFLTTVNELRSSCSKAYYLKLLSKYFVGLTKNDLSVYPAGVRAQAVDDKGNFIHDFLFIDSERILHTCNAPSPGATSSLPIGNYIVDKFINKIK